MVRQTLNLAAFAAKFFKVCLTILGRCALKVKGKNISITECLN